MQRLVERLARLPGIGNRSAQRMAMHLLKAAPQEAQELAEAIVDLKQNSRQCSVCCNLTQTDPCAICGNPARDAGLVLVVEDPNDVASFEATGMYQGAYHVLMGRLSPLDGLGPGELMIEGLLERVNKGGVREVILGTHPTLEGDGTALYLARELGKLGIKVTRLARGVPTGYSLDTASKAVLADAIQGRRAME
jgi:recombination protein RecR